MDDVTAACEMMTLKTFIRSVPLLLFLPPDMKMRMGVRSVDGWPSPLPCETDMDRPLPELYVLL